MLRVPLYLDQTPIDDLAASLYKLLHITDVASTNGPASDLPFRLLSEPRRQCCGRSRANDPSPDSPFAEQVGEDA